MPVNPRILFLALSITLAQLLNSADAGGGAEGVFLVVNPESEDSLTVANHYQDLREIPPGNVFYLPWNPMRKSSRSENFREEILKPIIEEINTRGLAGQIDTIAYSTHFPFSIDYRQEVKGKKLPPATRKVVSLTGASYLYQFTLSERIELFGHNSNFYCPPLATSLKRSQAFRGHVRWQPGGKADAKQGLQYLLCTALGVTYGDGNSVEEILRYLRSAKQADFTQPEASICYMLNGDIRTKVRKSTFEPAVLALRGMGKSASVVAGIVPEGRTNVIGLSMGSPKPILTGEVGLAPGAIVDNLTSLGGRFDLPLAKRGQTLLAHYLRNGAAGASGTVIEPTANPNKFPNSSLHLHYARGCSLAESFYQSVQGPFQLLIVGDPLCQPWAKQAEISVGTTLPAVVSGKINLQPAAKSANRSATSKASALEMLGYEIYLDGKKLATIAAGKTYSWDTTQTGDGLHRLVVIGIEKSSVQTQSRWSREVMVNNLREAIELRITGGTKFGSGETIRLEVECTSAKKSVITHNGRTLGSLEKGTGELDIAASKLGRGPVMLQARTVDSPEMFSRPIRIEIE